MCSLHVAGVAYRWNRPDAFVVSPGLGAAILKPNAHGHARQLKRVRQIVELVLGRVGRLVVRLLELVELPLLEARPCAFAPPEKCVG